MRNLFDNFLRMVNAMITFLNEAPEMLTKYPAIAAINLGMTAKVAEINKHAEKRGGRSTGLSGTKNQKQHNAIDWLYKVMTALHSVASGKKNMPDLVTATKCTSKWQLAKLKDSDLVKKCRSIHDSALPFLTELEGHNIKQADLDNLLAAGTEYEAQIGEISSVQGTKVGETENIGTDMHDLHMIVEDQLDSAFESLKDDEPEFYNKFKGVREVHQYGIRHEKPKDDNSTSPDNPPA